MLFEYEDLTIKQYLLYIGEAKCSMHPKITKDDLDYRYAIIDMHNIPCEALLNSNDPSAVVLSILCDFKNKDKQIVVNTILKRLRELSDEREYTNYLRMVNILSTNRNLEDEVEKGENMLSVDIEKTPFYKIGEKRGEQRGEQKGVLRTAVMMIEKFKLSIEEVAKELNISIDELKKQLDKKSE
jgi:predicted transposase YdaD